jgi:hypothetical protein
VEIQPLRTVSRRSFGPRSRVGAQQQRGLTFGHAFAMLKRSYTVALIAVTNCGLAPRGEK